MSLAPRAEDQPFGDPLGPPALSWLMAHRLSQLGQDSLDTRAGPTRARGTRPHCGAHTWFKAALPPIAWPTRGLPCSDPTRSWPWQPSVTCRRRWLTWWRWPRPWPSGRRGLLGGSDALRVRVGCLGHTIGPAPTPFGATSTSGGAPGAGVLMPPRPLPLGGSSVLHPSSQSRSRLGRQRRWATCSLQSRSSPRPGHRGPSSLARDAAR